VIDGIQPNIQYLTQIEVQLNPDRVFVVYLAKPDSPTEGEKSMMDYFERHGKLRKVKCTSNLEETYRNLRRALSNKVIFVYGPPLDLKK
jgi:hypothetical protein